MTVTLDCPACHNSALPVYVEVDGDQDETGTWQGLYYVTDIGPCKACGHLVSGGECMDLEEEAERAAHEQARKESGR